MKKTSLRKKGLNINTYGYNFSRVDFAITVLAFCCSGWILCYLHKLNAYYTMGIMIMTVALLPFMITAYFTYKHEKNRFEEYIKYFDYMKIYFKTYKKIKLALENVILLFPANTNMYKCLDKAIKEINATGDYKKALAYIDKDYHTSHLERLHNLFITGEMHGSDSVYENLDMINFESWKEDIQAHQNKKKTFRYMLYGMTLLAFILSCYGANMFGDVVTEVYNDPNYQLYTCIDIAGMILIFVGVYISLVNKKWLRRDD